MKNSGTSLDKRGVGQFLRREPLVHFLALAGLLFMFNYFWSDTQKEKIIVDQRTVDFLIKQREDLMLRKLTPKQRRGLIRSYIRDEILYREAYKRGLDKEARMRRDLIRKMRGLAMSDVDKPTEAQLKVYFDANRARFRRPPGQSFDHVYFRDPSKIPNSLLEKLQNGRDHASLGDYLAGFGRAVKNVSKTRLIGTLGPDAARSILAINDDTWHGPFESPRGAHFVRITGRTPARDSRFEDVKNILAQDWAVAQSRKAVEKEVERVRGEYEIVIEAEEFKP
jgi:peptidyl-prolyl cis-trans isomerase C